LRGGFAYPSALVVVGVGGEGDGPELDLDQAVVGVPTVGAQAVGDEVAVVIVLVIGRARGEVLVELVGLVPGGSLVVGCMDAVAQLVVVVGPVVPVARIVIGLDELAEFVVPPVGLAGGGPEGGSGGDEGGALAERVHGIREARDALVGKTEVVFFEEVVTGGVVGVLLEWVRERLLPNVALIGGSSKS